MYPFDIITRVMLSPIDFLAKAGHKTMKSIIAREWIDEHEHKEKRVGLTHREVYILSAYCVCSEFVFYFVILLSSMLSPTISVLCSFYHGPFSGRYDHVFDERLGG